MRFDSYHPAVNLIFYLTVLICSAVFTHPVYVLTGFISAWICTIVLKGRKAWIFNSILVVMAAGIALVYAYYNHYGVTVLGHNSIGNSITAEALIYGVLRSIRMATVVMWFGCIHITMTSDKIIYLTGKISPHLSLYLAIIFRLVPQMSVQWKKISIAKRGIKGKYSFFTKCSGIISWMIDHISDMTDSMKCRGYMLKGRTAYSRYRFDNRDRSCVIGMFICITAIWMAFALMQTQMIYNPEIIWNRPTEISILFYVIYGIFCMMPVILQMIAEIKFMKGERNEK